MKITRAQQRKLGRQSYERRGYDVVDLRQRGVAPGALLKISNGSAVRKVAVRTSKKRVIGLLRTEDNKWRTIPEVDDVLVVVPSDSSPSSVEILEFSAEDILATFDAAARQQKGLSAGSPVFVFLDQLTSKSKLTVSGLKKKAKWREVIPLNPTMLNSLKVPTAIGDLIDRFHRELAELLGVEQGKVQVEFRVVT